jgi:hypothetical protein
MQRNVGNNGWTQDFVWIWDIDGVTVADTLILVEDESGHVEIFNTTGAKAWSSDTPVINDAPWRMIEAARRMHVAKRFAYAKR